MAPDHNWNISADYSVRSHRQGAVARVVILAKHLVRPFVRLYTDHVVGRQAQINLYLYYVCKSLLSEVVRLQLESAALRNRLENLERGQGTAVAGPAGPGPTVATPTEARMAGSVEPESEMIGSVESKPEVTGSVEPPGASTQNRARAEGPAEAGGKRASESGSETKGQTA
jgi:hypothetical protein